MQLFKGPHSLQNGPVQIFLTLHQRLPDIFPGKLDYKTAPSYHFLTTPIAIKSPPGAKGRHLGQGDGGGGCRGEVALVAGGHG